MGVLGSVAAIVIVLLLLSVRMAQEYQRAVIFRSAVSKAIAVRPLLADPADRAPGYRRSAHITQQLDTQETSAATASRQGQRRAVVSRRRPERTVVSVANWKSGAAGGRDRMRDTIGKANWMGCCATACPSTRGCWNAARDRAALGVEIEAVELKDLDIPNRCSAHRPRSRSDPRKACRIIKAEGEMDSGETDRSAKMIGGHPARWKSAGCKRSRNRRRA